MPDATLISIDCDSVLIRFPVDAGGGSTSNHAVDDATLARWKSAQAAWDTMQAELRELDEAPRLT